MDDIERYFWEELNDDQKREFLVALWGLYLACEEWEKVATSDGTKPPDDPITETFHRVRAVI